MAERALSTTPFVRMGRPVEGPSSLWAIRRIPVEYLNVEAPSCIAASVAII
jgi:hypothetical protein